MLDSVDTLISFILIILVVSLVITTAGQMVSAVLNLPNCQSTSEARFRRESIFTLHQRNKDLVPGNSKPL